ncbi:MAG TPA: ASCH domain-containing protein [Marmoricola sp.]
MHAETGEGPIEAFWRNARRHARLENMPGYLGTQPVELVIPPVWSFGATDEHADELLDLVLSGVKTATASAEWDYEAEGEPLPRVGDLSIVTDSQGHPRALLQTSAVEVRPFDEVDAEHAYLEGEGDRSLDHWRRVHEQFFTENSTHGRGFSPDMPIVLERFAVRYTSE